MSGMESRIMKRSDVYKLAVVLSVFAVVSAFTGCSKSDDSTQSSSQDSTSAASDTAESKQVNSSESTADSTAPSAGNGIAGKWVSEEYSGSFVYTFNEDGTGSYDMGGNVLELTYAEQGEYLTINFLAEGYGTMNVKYSLADNKLTIYDSFGASNVFVRK